MQCLLQKSLTCHLSDSRNIRLNKNDAKQLYRASVEYCQGDRSVSVVSSHYYTTHTGKNLEKEKDKYNIPDKSGNEIDSIKHREMRGRKITIDRMNERRNARKLERQKKQKGVDTSSTSPKGSFRAFTNPNSDSTGSKDSSCSIM